MPRSRNWASNWWPLAARRSDRPWSGKRCGRWIGGAKKSLHAAERDTERVKGLRRDFLEALRDEDVTRFKCVDETGVHLTYARRHGRALGGRRVDAAVPLHNGPNVTVVAALTGQGGEAVMELDGVVNTASFAVYLDQVLGPSLQPGDVVVLDNLRVNKAAGLAELVEKRGRAAAVFAALFAGLYAHRTGLQQAQNPPAYRCCPHPRGPDRRLASGAGLDYGPGCPKLV